MSLWIEVNIAHAERNVILQLSPQAAEPSSPHWRIQRGPCSAPHDRSDSNVIQMDTTFTEQPGAFRRLLWLTAEPRQSICAVLWGLSPQSLSPALSDRSILLPLVHILSMNFPSSVWLYHFSAPKLNLKVQTFLLPSSWWKKTWRWDRTREKEILDTRCPPGHILLHLQD